MKTVSILEFRQRAKSILASIEKGRSIVLTYRGKPVARLEPITNQTMQGVDPFYQLGDIASPDGESLSNSKIDQIVYGE